MADLTNASPAMTTTGPTAPNVTASAPVVETQSSPNTGALTGAAPQNPPQINLQSPQAPAIPPHVGKLASIGHVFHTLTGQQNDYSVDPATGKTVATPHQNKPGEVFRNMLAGALMGGAAGSGNDWTTGAMKGGAAVVQDQRQQDLLRRQQAQEQYKNQIEAQKRAEEHTAFQSSEDLKKVEIAHMNALTAHENQLTQGENFKQHTEQADFGKAQMQPFLDAGIKPVFADVPESQMHDIVKNNKNASTLLWEPTGVKTGIDEKGNPTYETTYTAIDPSGKVKVTSGMLDTFKKAGMDTYDPSLFDVLKPGTELDARQYMSLVNRSQSLMNTKLQRDKTEAEIGEINARKAQATAAAAKDYAERDNYLEGKTKQGAFNKALANLNKLGDFDKLPPGDKMILGESAKDAAKGALDKYKIDKSNVDEPAAAADLQDYEFYNSLVKQAFTPKTPAGTPAPAAAAAPTNPAAAQFQKDQEAEAAKATAEQAKKDADYAGRPPEPEFVMAMGQRAANPEFNAAEQYLKDHPEIKKPEDRAAVREQFRKTQPIPKPATATGKAKGPDGKMHWTNQTGADLGIAE